ncbi:MAG: hypothetical protein ACRD4L_06620, partial [Pyrinomonadaceae bacterium]
ALTTRGMGEAEMREVARLIAAIIHEPESETARMRVRRGVAEITSRFPLYSERQPRHQSSATL